MADASDTATTPDRTSALIANPTHRTTPPGKASMSSAASGRSATPDLVRDDTSSSRSLTPPPVERALPQPASFYPNELTLTSVRRDELAELARTSAGVLRPEDDPYCSRGIPVFHPTMEEFKDFEGYMEAVLPWGQRSGIIKVVPPPEWTGTLPSIPKETLSQLRIKNPIQQNMQGISGLYRQNTIEKRKNFSVKDWFEKCNTYPFKGPGPKDTGRSGASGTTPSKRRRTRRGTAEESATPGPSESPAREGEDGHGGEGDKDDAEAAVDSRLPEGETAGSDAGPSCKIEEGHAEDIHMEDGSELPTPHVAEHVDPFYDDFDVKRAWLPDNTTQEDYSVEACREIERKFWRSLSLGEPSWYGADLKGSLFTEATDSWNVAKLPNLLNRLRLKSKLPGVNTTYLYFGMWAAAFAWHVEDCDLWSINYIHFGAPKQWYAIPPGKAETFERKMASYFPQDARRCNQFLRHKSFTVSPALLAKDDCRPNVLVQKQGEFVITYPRGYHAGFNLGFNCAESINFALESWIELGRRAQFCTCVEDSVRIDVDAVLAESALVEAIEKERAERKKQAESRRLEQQSKKRAREEDSAEKPSRPRKRRVVVYADEAATAEAAAKAKEVAERRACLFCPDTSPFPTLPIHSPPDKLCKAGSVVRGHVACARSIPELWIEEVSTEAGRKEDMIFGAGEIPKERWNLKCTVCREKKAKEMGAKIQCTKGACTRAYHVTCAMQHPFVHFQEMEVEEWVPKMDPTTDAVQSGYELVHYLKAELLCNQHNPAAAQMRKEQSDLAHRTQIRELASGSTVLIRLSDGTDFETLFLAPCDNSDDLVSVLSQHGLPMDVACQRVFLEGSTEGEDLGFPHDSLESQSDMFQYKQPVDCDKVALTPRLCSLLSHNPILKPGLVQLGLVPNTF